MKPVQHLGALRESAQVVAGLTILASVFALAQALRLIEERWWWDT